MRNLISIFLAISILSGTFREVFIYASFKLNQKYIAENLCINKEEPMSVCGGSCYLKEQLKESKEKELETPLPRFEYSSPINLILTRIEEDKLYFVTKRKSGYFHYVRQSHIEKHISDIFHPPKS